MYYRDALGAVIVYDITFKESFDKVRIMNWSIVILIYK
jgi:GTPase SAR1 family protein